MLAENLAKNLDPIGISLFLSFFYFIFNLMLCFMYYLIIINVIIDSVKEAQDLYSACFHEICRQVIHNNINIILFYNFN